jgi:hypothetical protein
MTEEYEKTRGIVIYFNDEHYRVAIEGVRRIIAEHALTQHNWPAIKEAIRNRQYAPGEPLELIHTVANLPLDENTDEEAYYWLELMVQNIDRTDGIIEEY